MMNRVTEAMKGHQYPYVSSGECTGACTTMRAERKSRVEDATSDPHEDDEKTTSLLKVLAFFALMGLVISLLANVIAGGRRDDGDDDRGDDTVPQPPRGVSPAWSPEKVHVPENIDGPATAASIAADNEPRYAPRMGLRGVWAGHRQLKNFARHATASRGQQLTEFVAVVIADAPRLEASFAIGCTEGLREYWRCAERDNSCEARHWTESMLLAGDSMERGVFAQAAIAHERIARELHSSGVGSDGVARELHTLCAAHCRFLEAQRVQMCHTEVSSANLAAAHTILAQSNFTLLPVGAQQHAAALTQMASARLVAFGVRV